jgi:1,4-alpha-glucan branching enzyme
MARAAGTRKVAFQFRAEPGSRVYLAGTFNKWDPTAKQLSDRDGSGVFAVNGVWCVDPECMEWVANDQGSLNSVLNVG